MGSGVEKHPIVERALMFPVYVTAVVCGCTVGVGSGVGCGFADTTCSSRHDAAKAALNEGVNMLVDGRWTGGVSNVRCCECWILETQRL